MCKFRARVAIVGFLMFSCGSPVRSCWAELKYDRILAVGGRSFELWLLKFQKDGISSILNPTGWRVWNTYCKTKFGSYSLTTTKDMVRIHYRNYAHYTLYWSCLPIYRIPIWRKRQHFCCYQILFTVLFRQDKCAASDANPKWKKVVYFSDLKMKVPHGHLKLLGGL